MVYVRTPAQDEGKTAQMVSVVEFHSIVQSFGLFNQKEGCDTLVKFMQTVDSVTKVRGVTTDNTAQKQKGDR